MRYKASGMNTCHTQPRTCAKLNYLYDSGFSGRRYAATESTTGTFVHIRPSAHSHRLTVLLVASILSLGLAGCGSTNWGFPYKATIQQGNWITSAQVAKLETGMTRDQVRFVLGTPTLQDIFHADRWDYPYYNQPGYGSGELRKFTVWFENDQLTRWTGDDQPDRQPFQKADSGKEAIPPAEAEGNTQQAATPGTDDAASTSSQAIEDATPVTESRSTTDEASPPPPQAASGGTGTQEGQP